MDPRDLLDTGSLRYGVSTAEKEKLARQGLLPGAPADTTAGQERADRSASGYLFPSPWPRLAKTVMPAISALKTSGIPFFGGESPDLQSYAQEGMNRALIDLGNAYTTPPNRSARPWEEYESSEAAAIRKRRPRPIAAALQAEALKK